MPYRAESFGQLASIDAHRAIGGAESICSAGIERHIRKVAVERSVALRRCMVIFESLHLTAHDDALPRSQSDVAAGAAMLAEAALDAFVHFGLDDWHLLQVRDMRQWVRIDNDSRVKQIARIGDRFQFLHDAVGFGSPLCFDKGSHIAARAMLSFQCAVVLAYDQRYYVIHQQAIAVDFLFGVEALSENEMQITVLGMAKDDGIVVVMLLEERLQVHCSVCESVYRECYVFHQRGGSAGAHCSHGGKHALANLPQHSLFVGIAGEACGMQEAETGDGRVGNSLEFAALNFIRRVELDQ